MDNRYDNGCFSLCGKRGRPGDEIVSGTPKRGKQGKEDQSAPLTKVIAHEKPHNLFGQMELQRRTVTFWRPKWPQGKVQPLYSVSLL